MTGDPVSSRRKVVAALGGGMAAGIAGCLGGTSQSYGGGASVPDSPTSNVESFDSSSNYANMGSSDGTLQVDYFGSFKCPYCAQFSEGLLREIVEDYVMPGDVQLRYRNLSYLGEGVFLGQDAPAIGRGALALWSEEPSVYWPFHEAVFSNQPPESRSWGTEETLRNFASAAGASQQTQDAVAEAVRGDSELDSLLQQNNERAEEVGVDATPQVVIDGNAFPALNEETVRREIATRI